MQKMKPRSSGSQTFRFETTCGPLSLHPKPLRTSGVAAIWIFWIYPGAAESEGAEKVG